MITCLKKRTSLYFFFVEKLGKWRKLDGTSTIINMRYLPYNFIHFTMDILSTYVIK